MPGFGFGLLTAYAVYLAIEVYEHLYGEKNEADPTPLSYHEPIKSPFAKQLTYGGILMIIFAICRGFMS